MKPMGSHAGNQWLVSEHKVDLSRAASRPVRAIDLDAQPQAVTVDANRSALV
ncbi:MAG: isochorismatase, partial [Comamonadaceae bacterium]